MTTVERDGLQPPYGGHSRGIESGRPRFEPYYFTQDFEGWKGARYEGALRSTGEGTLPWLSERGRTARHDSRGGLPLLVVTQLVVVVLLQY